MLIYHEIDGQLHVTEVTHGFKETKVRTFLKDIKKVPEKHLEDVKHIPFGSVYVVGNSSALGSGYHKRQAFSHYLDAIYEDPDQGPWKGKRK